MKTTTKLNCPDCDSSEVGYRNNGPHIEAVCIDCGRHITFVSKQAKRKIDLAAQVSGGGDGPKFHNDQG